MEGAPALTQFSSSNGGATAATPLPYMVHAARPVGRHGRQEPAPGLDRQRLRGAAARAVPRGRGRSAAVRVLAREGAGAWGGRISQMEIVGTARTCTLASDSAIRSTLGVNSSFLTFTA